MESNGNNTALKIDRLLDGFRIRKIDALPKLGNVMYRLEHERTGAQLIHLSNEDSNNCFAVAFRTTPKDSTGIAHILEHTVLCGSRRYPVRDPFFSMIKRSMNTFMNAFTASDWTMYPFSSQNETDFFNLMKVYLDAAFFPRLTELSFKQEGHRLEFEEIGNPQSALTYKGVVYNEMKGAMASPAQILGHGLEEALFPTVTYRFNAGGKPEEITKLTHQQLVDFHKLHYHPSNSFFYTYGDIPLRKHTKRINELVLSEFDRIEVPPGISDERRYSKPEYRSLSYPLGKSEDDGKKCQIALAWLTADIKKPLDMLTLRIVDLILLAHAGSPLRKRLLESNLGKALTDSTGLEEEIRESYFSVGLQGVAERNLEKVESLVLSTLQEIAEQGIDREQIDSAIHRLELDTREVGGGRLPYGLNLLLRFFGTWIHGGDPADAIDFDRTLDRLKTKMDEPRYFENRIREFLLDNRHRVTVVLKPDWEMERRNEEKVQKELAQYGSVLSHGEIETILEESRNLKTLQEREESVDCLPTLKVGDIPREIRFLDPLPQRNRTVDITFYDRPTNGIQYHSFYFRNPQLDDKDREWMPTIGSLLPNVGAGGLSYESMARLIDRHTGGFSAGIGIEKSFAGELSDYFHLSGKSLGANVAPFFEIAERMITGWDFSHMERVRTLIAQRANGIRNSVVQEGNSYASSLACRGFDKTCAIGEIYGGIHQVRFMDKLSRMPDDALKEELTRFDRLLKRLFSPQNLSILVVGEKSYFGASEKGTEALLQALESECPRESKSANQLPYAPQELSYQREACLITTPISHVAHCFKTANYRHADSPALLVLATLINSCFLHREIREKGGAYGSSCSYSPDDGIFGFVSFRDPHLGRTMLVYERVLPWLKKREFGRREVEEAILSTCGKMDKPPSPAGHALREYITERKGKTREFRNLYRQRILACTADDLVTAGTEWLSTRPSVSAVTSEEIVKRDETILRSNPLQTYPI